MTDGWYTNKINGKKLEKIKYMSYRQASEYGLNTLRR